MIAILVLCRAAPGTEHTGVEDYSSGLPEAGPDLRAYPVLLSRNVVNPPRERGEDDDRPAGYTQE